MSAGAVLALAHGACLRHDLHELSAASLGLRGIPLPCKPSLCLDTAVSYASAVYWQRLAREAC